MKNIMLFHLFHAFLLIVLCASASFAQQTSGKDPKVSEPSNIKPNNPIVDVTSGVIIGKAERLIKPPYPPAARAVRADGKVTIETIGDENGNIVFAKAVGGHPLLRAAAAQAARASKFSSSTMNNVPVKTTGLITYDFIQPDSVEIKVGKVEIAPNLTDAEIKELKINSTFQSKIVELAKKMKQENANFNEFSFVRNNKADVNVWIIKKSSIALEELQKVGFEITSEDERFNRIRGFIPLEKLLLLAELENVRSIIEP